MNRINKEKEIITGILALSKQLQHTGNHILEEITLKQWLLLTAIVEMGSGRRTIKQIASLSDTSRQNIRKQLAALENQGFIRLESSVNNLRETDVILTQKTRDYFCQGKNADYSSVGLLFQFFSDSELENFAKNISKLSNCLELFINNEDCSSSK